MGGGKFVKRKRYKPTVCGWHECGGYKKEMDENVRRVKEVMDR